MARQVARVLRPGGLFAFTVESAPETAVLAERGYRLLRRYACLSASHQ